VTYPGTIFYAFEEVSIFQMTGCSVGITSKHVLRWKK